MGYDLIGYIEAKRKQLDWSIKQLAKNGKEKAETEKNYKILLRQETLKLRDEGMAVGLIDKVVYGIPEVAEARFRRDSADCIYEANKEAINSLKLQIRILDNQISREWGNTQ